MGRLAPLLLAFMLVLPGCGNPTGPLGVVRVGEPFWLRYDEARVVIERGRSVRFSSVEDSTCPPEMFCFAAGDLVVRLAITQRVGDEGFVELHALGTPKSAGFGAYRISLLDATAPGNRELQKYRVRLVITPAD